MGNGWQSLPCLSSCLHQPGSRVSCTHPPSAHCSSKPLKGLTFPHLTLSVKAKLVQKNILPNPAAATVFTVQMGDQV